MKNAPSVKLTGLLLIAGAVIMISGAIFLGTTGTDLWAATTNGTMQDYMIQIKGHIPPLVANLSLWILGVMVIGLAGSNLSKLNFQNHFWSVVALQFYRIGPILGIMAFLLMLSLVLVVPAEAEALLLADAIGWLGTTIDDLATMMLIGFGPLAICQAAKENWMPIWLFWWGQLAGLVNLIYLISLFIDAALGLTPVIIVLGMGWLIASGIVLLRLDPKVFT